jgi:hypothetical protein
MICKKVATGRYHRVVLAVDGENAQKGGDSACTATAGRHAIPVLLRMHARARGYEVRTRVDPWRRGVGLVRRGHEQRYTDGRGAARTVGAGAGGAPAEKLLARWRRRRSDGGPAQSQRLCPQIVRRGWREAEREDANEEDLLCAGLTSAIHGVGRTYMRRSAIIASASRELLRRRRVGPSRVARSAVVVIVQHVPADPDATVAASSPHRRGRDEYAPATTRQGGRARQLRRWRARRASSASGSTR